VGTYNKLADHVCPTFLLMELHATLSCPFAKLIQAHFSFKNK
jgi:hypothetical protein